MAFLPALLFLLTLICHARPLNVTIDDGDGDPTTGLKPQYTDGWFTLRKSEDLVRGWNVDTTQIYNHTLSSISAYTGTANITLTFNGTNIWAYFAINTRFNMDMRFYVDDDQNPAGSFQKAKSSDVDTWKYNQLLFESKPLAQGSHTLILSCILAVPFFDYAIYSTDDEELVADDPLARTSSSSKSGPSTTPSSHKSHAAPNLAKIVIPVICGAVLTLGIFSWTLARRRRRRRSREHTTAWQEPEGMEDRPSDAAALARADARTEKAITPYVAQPQLDEKTEDTVPKQRLMDNVLGLKESDDTGGRIAPLPVPDLDAAGPDNGPTRTGQKRRAILEMMLSLDPLRPASHVDEARGESTAEIRAELERLRAEAEEARAENEMLRQAVEPPPYSDGGRSERGSVLVRGGRL